MDRAGLVATGALFAALVTGRAQAAIIVVDNFDVPGTGLNDETPTVPVGGNPGTTLGQQRLNALQYAADIWGSILASDVPILVAASFSPLSCGSSSATLGGAGTTALHRDFAGALVPGTYYAAALADKLAGMDLDHLLLSEAPGGFSLPAACLHSRSRRMTARSAGRRSLLGAPSS